MKTFKEHLTETLNTPHDAGAKLLDIKVTAICGYNHRIVLDGHNLTVPDSDEPYMYWRCGFCERAGYHASNVVNLAGLEK